MYLLGGALCLESYSSYPPLSAVCICSIFISSSWALGIYLYLYPLSEKFCRHWTQINQQTQKASLVCDFLNDFRRCRLCASQSLLLHNTAHHHYFDARPPVRRRPLLLLLTFILTNAYETKSPEPPTLFTLYNFKRLSIY